MHPLTYAWAKDRQDEEQQQKSWITAGCVLAFSRYSNSVWHTQGRLFLPHIQSYLDMEVRKALWSRSKAIMTPVLLNCCWILDYIRQDSRVELLLREIFIELRQNPAKPSMEYLPLYDLQARNLMFRGKSREAVVLGEQMIKIHETLTEDNSDWLASQHELGRAYIENGQVKEAIALLEQVVKTKITLAEDHPSRLASQHELGRAYMRNGQAEEAIALLEHVVEIERTKYPEGHPQRVVSEQLLASWS